jgi:hypothetical protein
MLIFILTHYFIALMILLINMLILIVFVTIYFCLWLVNIYGRVLMMTFL